MLCLLRYCCALESVGGDLCCESVQVWFWVGHSLLSLTLRPNVGAACKCRGMQKVLGPYNGEDLRWHPVTKEMSKPSFQASGWLAALPLCGNKGCGDCLQKRSLCTRGKASLTGLQCVPCNHCRGPSAAAS